MVVLFFFIYYTIMRTLFFYRIPWWFFSAGVLLRQRGIGGPPGVRSHAALRRRQDKDAALPRQVHITVTGDVTWQLYPDKFTSLSQVMRRDNSTPTSSPHCHRWCNATVLPRQVHLTISGDVPLQLYPDQFTSLSQVRGDVTLQLSMKWFDPCLWICAVLCGPPQVQTPTRICVTKCLCIPMCSLWPRLLPRKGVWDNDQAIWFTPSDATAVAVCSLLQLGVAGWAISVALLSCW